MSHNRIEAPGDLVTLYVGGASVLGLSNRFGVARGVVTRWLREAGIEPRNRKEAGALRVQFTEGELRAKRAERLRAYRARKAREPVPDNLPHGSPAAIATYGCRCDICTDAKREYDRTRRTQKVSELREQRRQYRLNNLEEVREQGRLNYARNAEAIKVRVKNYQQTAAGRMVKRAVDQRRRGVPFTKEGRDFASIIVKDPCAYCGGPGGTVDHIVALAAGGSGDWLNLTGACADCNSRKRAESLLHFLLRLQTHEGSAPQPQ